MSDFKLANIKKPLLGATVLLTTTVKASDSDGVGSGGKSQRGTNHLTLEEAPLENIIICVPGKSATGLTSDFRFLPDKMAITINPFINPFTDPLRISFIVSDVTAAYEDSVLMLAYSLGLSGAAPINTPRSLNQFALDLETLEILGFYNIPASNLEPQPATRIGQTELVRSKYQFDVKLDITSLPTMIGMGQDTIYVQAALLKRTDFEARNFAEMILSEMDTIQFVPNECPAIMDGQHVSEIDLDNPDVGKVPNNGGGGKNATSGDGSSGATDGK